MSEIPDEDTPIYAQMVKELNAKQSFTTHFPEPVEEEAAHE